MNQKYPDIEPDCFYDISIGLIIPHEEGAVITHQTNGCMCKHKTIKGFFIPLNDKFYDEIKKRYIKPFDILAKHNYVLSRPRNRMTLKKALKIGKLNFKCIHESSMDLVKKNIAAYDNVGISSEAWQWVILPKKFGYLTRREAVFIYPNSD